jgi:alanine dehydrogenase
MASTRSSNTSSTTRPAACARSSSGSSLAEQGLVAAAKSDAALARGINTFGGHVTYEPVARAHNVEYVPTSKLLG